MAKTTDDFILIEPIHSEQKRKKVTHDNTKNVNIPVLLSIQDNVNDISIASGWHCICNHRSVLIVLAILTAMTCRRFWT